MKKDSEHSIDFLGKKKRKLSPLFLLLLILKNISLFLFDSFNCKFEEEYYENKTKGGKLAKFPEV